MMAGQILKAAVRLFATMTVAFSFLAAQPQGIAAFSGTIAGGDSDSAMTGTGPTSPQPAAKIAGSGNGPIAPTRGGTGSGGGTKGGTKSGTKSGDTGETNTANTTATGNDNTLTGTATTGDTGTVSGGVTTGDTNPGVTASADDDTANDPTDDGDNDVDNNNGNSVLGVQDRPGSGQTGTDVDTRAGSQQGGAVAGLQSLPSTSTPAGSPLGALTALAGAVYAITRRMRS